MPIRVVPRAIRPYAGMSGFIFLLQLTGGILNGKKKRI